MNALDIQDVAVSFGGVHAVNGVSLELAKGERRVILGPNGAGKSTLLNMIGGQVRPDRGSIRMFGQELIPITSYNRAHRGLARTFQVTTLLSSLTVEQNIRLAMQAFSSSRYQILRPASAFDEMVDRVNASLAEWRFEGERSVKVSDLSYGEQRKLEIAMALAHQPRLLLLDEPTAGLSTLETEKVVALIKSLSRDVTVVAIEHDMDVAFEIGEWFTIMNQGQVLVEGTADVIRNNPEIQAIYFGEDDL
jgi:branched-chain amino acid transport system ATP-binding protein